MLRACLSPPINSHNDGGLDCLQETWTDLISQLSKQDSLTTTVSWLCVASFG